MLVKTDEEGIDLAKAYLSYFPSHWEQEPPPAPPAAPGSDAVIRELIPADENKPFDIKALIDALVDADSFLEVHPRWAKELVVGYARLEGRVVGIVANQPKQKGGVLFVDSADKAARFIQTCNAFNVPLLFLADVPGFMIGTAVERQGIIRHGAKMISAVSEATVPKLSVIVRKAYGAGLYAMAGPAFDPDACLALPTASIAVMGPQAAVNAVFYNQLQAIEDPDERARRTEELRREYAEDIDILHLASELVVDAVIQPEDLRDELVKRFALAAGKARDWPRKRNPITPGVGRASCASCGLLGSSSSARTGRAAARPRRRRARPAARGRASRRARAGRTRAPDRASRPGTAGWARRGGSGGGRRRRAARRRRRAGRRRSGRSGPGSDGGSGSGSGSRRGGSGGSGAARLGGLRRVNDGSRRAAPPARAARRARSAGSGSGALGGGARREGRLALGRGVAAGRHRGRVLGTRGRRARGQRAERRRGLDACGPPCRR